jgi:hypothetical protein
MTVENELPKTVTRYAAWVNGCYFWHELTARLGANSTVALESAVLVMETRQRDGVAAVKQRKGIKMAIGLVAFRLCCTITSTHARGYRALKNKSSPAGTPAGPPARPPAITLSMHRKACHCGRQEPQLHCCEQATHMCYLHAIGYGLLEDPRAAVRMEGEELPGLDGNAGVNDFADRQFGGGHFGGHVALFVVVVDIDSCAGVLFLLLPYKALSDAWQHFFHFFAE